MNIVVSEICDKARLTIMLCFALSAITDKPIKLFQIMDNESTAISEQDKEAIIKYSKTHGNKTVEILDDSYQNKNTETTRKS